MSTGAKIDDKIKKLPEAEEKVTTETKIEKLLEAVYVHNVWYSEGGCSEDDGDSEVTPSFSPTCACEGYCEHTVEVKPGQVLLITWEKNTRITCCSGYHKATLEVLDEEPDFSDMEKYPEYSSSGDLCEYEVKSYETLESEILDS
tara:strand:- start:71 stop:505 length:435 start_codon:yes stop_codon:yes gene_type:complete